MVVYIETISEKHNKNLLQNNDGNEEKVAELWLNSFGPINTATYGGVPTSASNKTISKV